MAKPADYTQQVDQRSVAFGGLINEDVMDQIWDISSIPLPFTDLVGSGSVKNAYFSWTTDELPDPVLGGWLVDGADSDKNDSRLGLRVGNHCGILTRELQVTERAQAVDTIGKGNELSYQVQMRQKDLRRAVEANALGTQGSQQDDGNLTPGIPAGFACMIPKVTGDLGTQGVFTNGTWAAAVPPAKRALTEKLVRDGLQDAWQDGGNPTVLMSVPGVIRKLSEYMFTSSSRIATLTRETKGVGKGEAAVAVGSVNVFITDFGQTATFLPNRIQRMEDTAADDSATVFLLDPDYSEIVYLKRYRTEALAKTGLADKRHIAVDWSTRQRSLQASRVILGVDPAAAVTTG
jgi:hypothetical protein